VGIASTATDIIIYITYEHTMLVFWSFVMRKQNPNNATDVFPNGETNPQRIKDGMFKARVQAVKAA
jgi:hypothetical protein